MRAPLAGLALLLAVTAPGGPAAAGRGATGAKDMLMHVADTRLTGIRSDTFSLCHLVSQRTAFRIIPLTYSVRSYVLADFGCDTTSYIPLTAAQIATMKAEGVISADIPETPVLPLRYTAYSYGTWAVILGLLAALLTGRIPLAVPRTPRSPGPGRGTAPFELKLVEAMMLAAGADGHLDDREVGLMARAVSKITGSAVSQETIRALASESTRPATPADFHDFGAGLDELQKTEVLRAALAIAVADGAIASEKRAFLEQLALGLMIPVTAIDTMLGNAGLAPNGAPA